MRVEIENIGIIDKASVHLNGLTVIAGENDTGKSTVGKLVFAIVKAMSRYEQDLEQNKDKKIKELVEDIYLKIRENYDLSKSPKIVIEFIPNRFYRQLRNWITNKQPTLFDTSEDLKLFFQKKKERISRLSIDETAKSQIIELLEDLLKEIVKDDDILELQKKALKRALISEFLMEISPKKNSIKSQVKFKEGENSILNIIIDNDDVYKFEVIDDILPFDDVTFIESPMLIQLSDLINHSETLIDLGETRKEEFRRPKVTFHIKDLITKIQEAEYVFELFDNEIMVSNEISKIIDGQFAYDKRKKDFIFQKEDVQFRSINTASGIKAFGIIQSLLLADFINKKSLLIIDEPETHLHPKWQVEYARLIIELVKEKIPVLLTSHSPYLIQALKHFSEKESLDKDIVHFYLAEKNKNDRVEMEEVTTDLNRIFAKLAKPLQDLVWK